MLILLPAVAQEAQPDQQKAMEAYMRLMEVNENHKFLEGFAGEWLVQATGWMMPGTDPFVSEISSRAEMILGGRFLLARVRGMMMGRPFEGLQLIGYDNLKKEFVTFWIDSTSTAFYLTFGTLDESGKILNEAGLWPDPATGGTIKVQAVTRSLGLGEYTYEMFMPGPDGKEFKTLEYKAKRK